MTINSRITYQNLGGIALLTLNRPQVRNAIDDEMRGEMTAALDTAGRDPEVRALVLTGAGKAFCSGGDIRAMRQRMQVPEGEIAFNGWSRQQRTHHTVSALYNLPKPTIAAVNGASTGLGSDLAMACDFVIASQKQASFAWNYALRGLIPDGGGMYFLPRRIGITHAKELIFSGRTVCCDEALALGIVDRTSTAETLIDDAVAWARKLSVGAGAALALGKTILNQSLGLSVEQVFGLGSQAQAICYTSGEHRSAVEAFLAKSAGA